MNERKADFMINGQQYSIVLYYGVYELKAIDSVDTFTMINYDLVNLFIQFTSKVDIRRTGLNEGIIRSVFIIFGKDEDFKVFEQKKKDEQIAYENKFKCK